MDDLYADALSAAIAQNEDGHDTYGQIGITPERRPLDVNLMACTTDTQPTAHSVQWAELVDLLNHPQTTSRLTKAELTGSSIETAKSEKDGAAWIPACLIEQARGRCSTNIDKICALVLDIDDGLSIEDVRAPIGAYEYVIHSTFSHSTEKPKWRVVLPLSCATPSREIASLFDAVNAWYGGRLDEACGHDPARMYFLPRCPADEVEGFISEHHRGEWLDPDKVRSSSKRLMESLGATARLTKSSGMRRRFESALEGARHSELLVIIGTLVSSNLSRENVLAECLAWNRSNSPPLEEHEVERAVDDVIKKEGKNAEEVRAVWAAVVDTLNLSYVWINNTSSVWSIKARKTISCDHLRRNYHNTEVAIFTKGASRLVNHAEAWLQSPDRRTCSDIVFRPGQPAIVGDCFNLWAGWPVQPLRGPVTKWTELLDHLFKGDAAARIWIEQWLAYPIQFPGTKLNTAVVIWSPVQGVGKSILGSTIGKLYDPHFGLITAADLASSFNAWARDVQFVLGEENSSGDHRADSHMLKHLITGEVININQKYQPVLTIDNRANFLFTSNSASAFHLETFDRRFFVWEIVEKRLSDTFFREFVEWRNNGGLAALMHHLLHVDLTGFHPKSEAPITSAKEAMKDASMTELERWLFWLSQDTNAVDVLGKEIIHCDDLAKLYRRQKGKLVSVTAIAKALAGFGNRSSQRPVIKGLGRITLRPLVNHEAWEGRDISEWASEYLKKEPVILWSA